jgi:predicted RNase H-like HicB family nuclease
MTSMIQAQYTLIGCTRREGGWFFAHCPPLDITTQGRTLAEAKQNLQEAAGLFIISCIERGTLDAALRELGFVKVEAQLQARMPANAFKMVIPVPMRFQKPSPCPA